MSNQEIAAELYLSVNTVKAHAKHLYAKLDVHRRGEAVERARALGLLAPSSGDNCIAREGEPRGGLSAARPS